MINHVLILFLLFLTGFSGAVFFFFDNASLEKIKRPGLLLALGTLGGTIFFHLVPEYVEQHRDNLRYTWLALPGFLVWFLPGFLRRNKADVSPSLVALMAGDAVHNAFTSLLWLSLCLASGKTEIMLIPALLLHEILHKAGNFGIMIFSGLPKQRAMFLNLFSSLFFFAGLVLYASEVPFDGTLFMPVIVGTLSYTFFSGLYHERAAVKHVVSWAWLAGGLFLMIFVTLSMGGWH